MQRADAMKVKKIREKEKRLRRKRQGKIGSGSEIIPLLL